MQEKPKVDAGDVNVPAKTPDKAAWAEDQKSRSYYYDDAHGYQTYDPEEDEDASDESSGGFDVNIDRPPALHIEPQDAEKKPGEMSREDGDPDM
jgi:hypothetical protein